MINKQYYSQNQNSMKKLLLLLLTVMMFGFFAAPVSAQQIVEIGTGTSTSYNGPFNSLWGYSFVEQIYTAEEIDMPGSIISISFNNNSSGQTNNITVYMKNVDRATFASGTDYETVTAADIVYSGSHNFSNGWSTIILDTPFEYDGVSNLMIAVHEYTSGYSTQYFYYTTTTNSMVSFHSDSADPDPYNLGSYTGNNYTSNNRPNVKLEIMPSSNTCFAPISPVLSDVTAFEATLSWTPREGQSAWEVCCGIGTIDLDEASWTSVTDTFYTFTGLTPASNYVAYVRTNCDGEVSNPRQVPFTTEATCASVPSAVTVSNITATTVDVNWTAGEDDYAWEVVAVPSNEVPEDGTIEQASTHPITLTDLQDNTQYKVYVRTDCGDGDHSYWATPATFTTFPHCSSPLNVTVSQITASSALVSWQPAEFGATSYAVEYTLASEENWTMEPVEGTQFMLSGLEPDSAYNVMVYSICDLGTADTIHKSFATRPCMLGGELAIGNGTTTNYVFPVNNYYHYTYSQQIFLASEMNGPAEISSISFQYAYGSPTTSKTNVTIYLGHTTQSDFPGTTNYIPVTNLQQVYTGHLNCQQGWNTFTFTTPFQYNGTDNLVLAVDDNSDAYNGSSYTFYVHSTGNDYRALAYYSDSNNPDPSNPTAVSTNTSRITNRSNVIFGIPCEEDVVCVSPNVYVLETSESSVTLDWAPGYTESAWDVEYSVDNETWEEAGTVNTHPYEVTGLNPDTRYYFRVRSNCGGEESNWSLANARTECGPLQLPYTNNFDDVISDHGTNFITCWSRYTTNPERVVRCYGSATHSGSYALDFNYSPSCTTAAVTPMIDPSIPLNTVMLDFWAYSSLGQGWMEVGTMSDPNDFSTYEFYDTVRLSAPSTWENLMISFENYSGSNQYIAFLEINGTTTSYIFDDLTIDYIPNCVHPNNLVVDALTSSTVTLSWAELGSASAWAVEYGPAGFTLGEGTVVTTSDNPFTVEDLTPATTYDFYVYSDCGGLLSDAFGPVSATPGQYIFGVTGSDTLTTCGAMLFDNGGANGDYSSSSDFTLVLYPENPDAKMALVGTLNTESISYDYLTIYDGVGTTTQLAKIGGSDQTVNVLSQSGPLTLVFHSDVSVVRSGFAIMASCVTCYPPTNLIASDPTMDGATVSWSGVGDSYVLFLNGDMTTGYDAVDTTYTFTGLNSSTVYSVQVAAICDGDTSMLSSSYTFATGCEAITITDENPWTENFENYTGNGAQMFICWETPVTQVVDNGTAPFVYCGYGQACHSGQNSAELKGGTNMLVLPEFTNDLATLRLSFWATTTSTSNPGSMDIGYITDVTDSSTFVSLTDAGTPGPRGGSNAGNGNYMGPFNFNDVTVAGARIALRFNGYSGLSWNLDDFVVELAPNCTSPEKTSVTASNIGGHVATISWVDNDDTHNAWTVFYKKSNEEDWSMASANDTAVTLTGLDPVSTYDVYVITDCGTSEANPDATHTIHFTTTIACPAPSNLTLTDVSTDEATITWSGTASSYNVEYGETGFTPGEGIIDVANTESFTMTNLEPSTSYTIYVNSDCSDNNDSLSSTVSFTFTTTQVPAELPYTADFTVSNEWILNNGSCSNYWTIGSVDSVPALFVTNNGTTPGYSTSSSSIVSAEKLITVGENPTVNIGFDVKSGGESSWDYLKVFFAPAEVNYPAATSVPDFAAYSYSINAVNFENYLSQTGNTNYPYKINLTQGNTLHVEVEMPNPNENATSTSTAKLVFVWRNDSSSGTQPGAIISNVNVFATSCPMPTDLTADNVTATSADISWTSSDDVTSWVLEYKAAGSSSWIVENVTTMPYTLNNLTPTTNYTVRVKSDCGDDESGYAVTTFTTQCAVEIAPYSEDFSGFNTSVSPCWGRFSGLASDVFAGGALTSTTSGWSFSSSNVFPVGHPKVNIWGSSVKYWLVSPAIDLSQLSNPVLTFDLALTDYNNADPIEDSTAQADDKFMVIISTDYGNTWSAANATVWNNTGDGDYVYNAISYTGDSITISLSQYAGQTIRIAFYGESTQSGGDNDLHIANVAVNENGSGPGPVVTDPTVTTGAASNIAQTTATLNGTINNPDNVTITAKGFEWKTTVGGTYTPVTVTGNNLTYDLTNLTANTGYTYKAFITFNGTTIYGDEVTFTTLEQGQLTEPSATTGQVSNLTQTTATLNGTISNPDNVTITAQGFEWKAVSASSYTVLNATGTTMSSTLSNLTANTNYTYRAFVTTANGTHYGNNVNFTTLEDTPEPCDVPTNLHTTDIQNEAIAIAWDANANVSSWNIRYSTVGGTWNTATSNTNSYTITGLTGLTDYEIQVQANCGNGNLSEWSGSITAQTTNVGIEEHLLNSISLFPNPANDVVNVQCTMNNVQLEGIEVIDVYGKVVRTVAGANNYSPIRINVSGLANGMYFVRVTTDEGVVTKNFIKR